MIKFTLPIKPITKKNSGQIITNPKTGRPFMIPSPQYRQFEKDCLPYLTRLIYGVYSTCRKELRSIYRTF